LANELDNKDKRKYHYTLVVCPMLNKDKTITVCYTAGYLVEKTYITSAVSLCGLWNLQD